MKTVNSNQSSVGTQNTENRNENADSRLLTFDFRLYLITDRKLFNSRCALYFALDEALSAGAKAIQLREKDLPTLELLEIASWLRELTKEYGAKLFINNSVDIALAVGADGVHLSQKSMPAYTVRKVSGSNKFLIGCSTHSIDEALKAVREGTDFITLGPVYETPSKLGYGAPIGIGAIKKVKSLVSIPVFAIGGIKPDKVQEVKEAGADGVALISAVLTAKNIKETTKEFLRLLK